MADRINIIKKSRYKKVLGKFNKSELPGVAVQLGLGFVSETSTKKELLSILVDRCMREKVSSLDILKLELKYLTNHPNSLKWKAYRLDYANPSSLSSTNINPQIFVKRLQLYLGDVCNYEMVQAGSWIGIHINDECHVPYTCCLLRYPPSPFIFLSGLRRTHLATVLEAISLTLDSVGCTELGLSGNSLDSLVDMVLNQSSQGHLSAYRLNQVDSNPLLVPHECYSLVPSEGPSKNAESRSKGEEIFGVNPLPTLEKFTFNLEADLPDGSNSVSCCIKLTGSSVLEGMKAAITNNCFSHPIPEIIQKMPRFGSNSVTLDSKSASP